MKKFIALILVSISLLAFALPAMACVIPGCDCAEENECGLCHLCDYHYNVWWKYHTKTARSSNAAIYIVDGVNPKMKPCCEAQLYEVTDVSTNGLNVRIGPSTQDPIAVRVRNAGLLWVLDFVGKCDEWAYVSYAPDRYGYVMTSYLIPAGCYCEGDNSNTECNCGK